MPFIDLSYECCTGYTECEFVNPSPTSELQTFNRDKLEQFEIKASGSQHHVTIFAQLSTSRPRQKTSKVTGNTNITKNLSHAETRNCQTFEIGKARNESGNYDVGSCNPTPRLQRSDGQRQSATLVCICAL